MRILTPLFLSVLFASCSLQATLTLPPGPGPVTVSGDFSLSSAARAAWSNLREVDSTLPADPLAPELWHQGLGERSHVASTARGASVTLEIPDPKEQFPNLKADSGSWDLTIDRATMRRLAAMTSWSNSPALDSLLPSPETKVTEDEYRDLLVYLLGPGTPEAAARVLVDGSTVQLAVVAPRPILSAEGAVSFQGRTAMYQWPLVRVLTLERPIRIHLTF